MSDNGDENKVGSGYGMIDLVAGPMSRTDGHRITFHFSCIRIKKSESRTIRTSLCMVFYHHTEFYCAFSLSLSLETQEMT